ncbi:MAG: hypothetical protein JW818_15110, partial [Pirellulales bacterium]|nr:hypothetical protein [Pirellulales bacterium]
PYLVSMDMRIDELRGFDKSPDQFIICNNAWPEAELKGGPASGWHIRIDSEDGRRSKARHWTFISGSGTKGKETRIDSGIPAREGTVYSFRVLVDPEGRRWTPSIAVDGGPFKQFDPMGVRTSQSPQECGYWPYLYFYWILADGNRGGEVERLGFSVDSIKISAAQ